jgi:DNA-binding MarR family transcriptional regulator
MKYKLLKEVITLVEDFENSAEHYPLSLSGFKRWIVDKHDPKNRDIEPDWEGKEKGRSPESVINTLIVHMNRYARTYSRAAILDSGFSTQDDFIYLITLRAGGEMTKMDLIKKNSQDKPTGIQIINRLIGQQWVIQRDSTQDKRSKIISITPLGLEALDAQMDKIRKATRIVTGNLDHAEKMTLIRLLDKLDHFHKPIFLQNIEPSELLQRVTNEYLPHKQHDA